jgi:DNA-binding NarL/FixJ family response regulator
MVVDNHHPVVLLGLRSLLHEERDIELVGHAATPQVAIARAKKLRPDVFLLTSSQWASAGEPLRQLRGAHPSAAVVVLLLGSDQIPKVLEWAGAHAVIAKGSPNDAIASALKLLGAGGNRSESSAPPSSGLSRRELQVLTAIAEGFTNKQVADELGISVRTVETHRERLMRKLDVQGTAALTKAAITMGLVNAKNR